LECSQGPTAAPSVLQGGSRWQVLGGTRELQPRVSGPICGLQVSAGGLTCYKHISDMHGGANAAAKSAAQVHC
jgi:hypothetical protein